MQLPRLAQRIVDRFQADTDLGYMHGWRAAQAPQARHGLWGRLRLAGRWLNRAGQSLDVLLARDAAQPAPASRVRRLNRAATMMAPPAARRRPPLWCAVRGARP